MLYTTKNIKDIDLGKYKRLITIGCSFTRYKWATWADLLAAELSPDAEFINQGQSGAGNLYIAVNLNQYMNKLNLGHEDLVVIMWSTFYREDRYMYKQWITPGNIFTQNQIDMDFVEKHCDVRGMMLRDLSIIDSTMRMLQHQDFDSVGLMGVNIDQQSMYAGISDEDAMQDLDEIKQFYNNIPVVHPDLCTFCGGSFEPTYKYVNSPHKPWGGDGSIFEDYHPTSFTYRDYLTSLGFNMTDSSKEVAEYSDKLMKQIYGDDVFLDPQWPWKDGAKALL